MLHLSVLTHFLVLEGALCMVEITQGPQNMTVEEGESAVFTCSYTGSEDFPTWHINGANYAIQGETLGLPDRHRYSNQMMTVSNVQISDDGTTYSCSFLFGEIASSTAVLTVLPATHDNFTEASSTTNPTSLATNINFAATSVTSQSFTSDDFMGSSQPVMTLVLEPGGREDLVQVLSIGIAAVVLISIAICVVLTCMIVRSTRSRRKNHTLKQSVEEPAYEYVTDILPVTSAVKVESNVCYATGIMQEPNICYAVTKEPEYAEIQSGATVIATRLNEVYGSANQVTTARQEVTNATTNTGEQKGSQNSPDSVRAHEQNSQRNSTIDE